MPYRRLIMTLIFLALTSACAIKAPPDDIISPERAMAFGYIQSDKFPIDAVDIHEYGVTYIVPFKNPPRVLVFQDGYFMAENLKPGKYYINGFYSSRKKYSLLAHMQSAFQIVIDVKPGSITYVGSYKIDDYEPYQIENRGVEFTIEETMRPGEREALNRFFNITAGTAWQKKIARRMQAMRQ